MDLVVQSHNQDKNRLCAIINEQRAQFNEVIQQAVAKMADDHKMMVEALLSKDAAAAEERQRQEAERQAAAVERRRLAAAAAAERQRLEAAAAEERQRQEAAAAAERQRLEAAATEERKAFLATLDRVMAHLAAPPPVPPPPPAAQPMRRPRASNNGNRVRLPYQPQRPPPMLARQFPVYDKQPYTAFKNALWFIKAMRNLQRGPPFVKRGDVLCAVNEEGFKLRHVHLHPTLAAAVDRHFAE